VSEEKKSKSLKKYYSKPVLSQVKLMPGETALAGCKYNNMTGPGYGTLGKCGNTWGTPCNLIRSS